MGLRLYKEPELKNPVLIAAWPGIGNIGLVAVDTLRKSVGAEHFAEIEPWHFFYPHGISVQDGELQEMHFPRCRFFFKRLENVDCIFFIGEQQPGGGRKGYEMADMILDLASLMGCEKIYTAAAAVAAIHHTARPRVWAVPNHRSLVKEMRRYTNTVMMTDIEDRAGEGNITGLNGLLLGVASKRGVKGVCLLGEMPSYISQLMTPYPRASKSIIEVLGQSLGITPNVTRLDEMSLDVEKNIENFYEMMPSEMRDRIDQLKRVNYAEQEEQGEITEDDRRNIMQGIEDLFKKGGQED